MQIMSKCLHPNKGILGVHLHKQHKISEDPMLVQNARMQEIPRSEDEGLHNESINLDLSKPMEEQTNTTTTQNQGIGNNQEEPDAPDRNVHSHSTTGLETKSKTPPKHHLQL